MHVLMLFYLTAKSSQIVYLWLSQFSSLRPTAEKIILNVFHKFVIQKVCLGTVRERITPAQ
jgi:hypothetical protein